VDFNSSVVAADTLRVRRRRKKCTAGMDFPDIRIFLIAN